jgi:uncharacterized protein YdeI (YjbR/CyaY-like superfamily)
MAKINSVEEYIANHEIWKAELLKLRSILLNFKLVETIKWGAPVFTLNGKNLVGISAFKHHYGLWFFQGALLSKNTKLLVNAQEGKTKVMRQIKLDKQSPIDIKELVPYILEAIELHKAGKEIRPERNKNNQLTIAPELINEFNKDPELKKAFRSLTLGKQRDYSNYILEGKRDATKIKRLNKIIPMIKSGLGLYDKYLK